MGILPPFFIAVVFGGSALYFLYKAKVNWDKYRASEDWPTTNAKIIHSEVVGGEQEPEGYRADIQYTYLVNGKKYQCDRIWFGLTDSGGVILWTAKKGVARYPVGKSAPIFYNPNDPQEAILERKYIWNALIFGMLA